MRTVRVVKALQSAAETITRAAMRDRYPSCQLLTLLVLLLTVPVHARAATAPVAESAQASRFERTVDYLRGADPQLRAAFALQAIARLEHVYAAEAELARDQFQRGEQDASLPGWSAAVERFAAQLPELAAAIEDGADVTLGGGGLGGVVVAADRRMVMLVHPRPDQQAAFEADLLALFCARQPCDTFTPRADVAPIPVTTASVEPRWLFSEDGAACVYDTLQIEFPGHTGLGPRRALCRQVLHEILTLSDEIAWQRRHGVAVAWDTLAISATSRRPQHRVQLNSAGDSVLLVAPVLYSSDGLLRELAPWLRARSGTGDASIPLSIDARRYGWE